MSKKPKKAKKASKTSEVPLWSSDVPEVDAAVKPTMNRNAYEKQMRCLHAVLVAMEEWVKAAGAKVCIVFEGRDTAGKGGTIKRITERVSPRGHGPAVLQPVVRLLPGP